MTDTAAEYQREGPRTLTFEDGLCEFRRQVCAMRELAGGRLDDEQKSRIIGIVSAAFASAAEEHAWSTTRPQPPKRAR